MLPFKLHNHVANSRLLGIIYFIAIKEKGSLLYILLRNIYIDCVGSGRNSCKSY